MGRPAEYWAVPNEGPSGQGPPSEGRAHECAKGTRMIFKRGRKRGSDAAVEDSTDDVGVDELDEPAEAAAEEPTADRC